MVSTAPTYPDFPPRALETDRPAPWAHQIQDRLDLRVLSFGGVRINREWRGPDYYSSHWRVYVNRQPGAVLLQPQGEFPLRAHHAVVIPPWIHFDTRCEVPVDHAWLHFLTPSIPDQVVQRCLPNPVDVGPTSGAAEMLQRLADGLVGRTNLTFADIALGKLVATQALADLLAQVDEVPRDLLQGHLTQSTPFSDLIQHIDAAPDYPWTVALLAERTRHSADHLTRQLKKHLGITPGDLIQERRLILAAHLLLTSQDTIDAIAERCGFANRYSFSRSFSRRYGIAPAAYRQRGW